MNKSFTKEDIIKKHETNVKSAFTVVALSGVLGLIYIVRYFITDNFDFHFSLSFPEMMLKLGHGGTVSSFLAYGMTAAFFALYLLSAVLILKNAKYLKLSLALYAFDCVSLLFYMLVVLRQFPGSFTKDLYIEVILHFFIILFLSVGVYSDKKLKKRGE